MEAEFIAWLRERIPPHPSLLIGPGDDAAVLRRGGAGDLIVTVDMLTEGVDFLLSEVDPRRIGRKALAVNLSDIAAMAGRPMAAVVAVALPRRGGMALAKEIYEGIAPLAAEFDVAIAGGDTNSWDGGLVVSITLLGEAGPKGPLRRGGARPGDWIVATGQFGGSILGRHFDFVPRVREATLLHERYELHAGIDVSDGLALDTSRIAAESRCGALIDLDAIPVSDAARILAAQSPVDGSAIQRALGDGEDFELVLAVPPDDARRMLEEQPLDVRLTRIGELIAEPGLWRTDGCGGRAPLEPRGYQHRLDA